MMAQISETLKDKIAWAFVFDLPCFLCLKYVDRTWDEWCVSPAVIGIC